MTHEEADATTDANIFKESKHSTPRMTPILQMKTVATLRSCDNEIRAAMSFRQRSSITGPLAVLHGRLPRQDSAVLHGRLWDPSGNARRRGHFDALVCSSAAWRPNTHTYFQGKHGRATHATPENRSAAAPIHEWGSAQGHLHPINQR